MTDGWKDTNPGAERDLRAAWWPLWAAATAGDLEARTSLLERVALEAREAGEHGRPASAPLARWLELDAPSEAARRLTSDLVQVAANAHAIGAATRNDAWHRERARRLTPVLSVSPKVVAAFLGPEVSGDVVEHVCARLFQLAIGRRARIAAIDVTYVTDDAPVVDAVSGIERVKLPPDLQVGLTGRSPDAPRFNASGVEVWPDLATVVRRAGG